MVFEAVAKVIAARTDCAVQDGKLESTFKDLNIEIELTEKVETVGDLVKFIETKCMG